MRVPLLAAAIVLSVAEAAVVVKRQDYFQTSPELYPGPIETGKPPFLAQTNPAPFPSVSYIPPQPLETQAPIPESPADNSSNIFELHGELTHYFSSPKGFGVDEYPLPHGAKITQLHMLHRHGARYPTRHYDIYKKLGESQFNATGELAFLNNWSYKLGLDILVPLGQQELFDSGTLHQYLYGHLYPNDGKKIIARSTTEDRMLKSAEYFLSGFFGLGWTHNATLEVIMEKRGFNNSLAGYFACPNSGKSKSFTGSGAIVEWSANYLKDAHARLNKLITFDDPDTELTMSNIYDMQLLCPFETVALGYSAFCPLFTHAEWQGHEYSKALGFAGNAGFQSPTARAVGIGYVQELRARLTHQYLTKHGGSANISLDNNPRTFPLNQSLYFDFSHDTNIMAILTAFGLKQFGVLLPTSHIVDDRDLIVSHVTPFAARLDIEIITAPRPVSPSRSRSRAGADTDADANADYDDDYDSGGETTYVHFLMNQRTIPLGASFEVCGARDDGWCELGAFLEATASAYADSRYEFACFGDYPGMPYGEILNGAPVGEEGDGDYEDNEEGGEVGEGGEGGEVENNEDEHELDEEDEVKLELGVEIELEVEGEDGGGMTFGEPHAVSETSIYGWMFQQATCAVQAVIQVFTIR